MTADHPTPADDDLTPAEQVYVELQAARAELARRDAALADLTRQRDDLAADLDDMRAVPPAELQSRIEAELRDEVERLHEHEKIRAQVIADHQARLIAADAARAQLERQAPVIEAARAWRRYRNFEYRPGEINPHLLTAHQEDLDLARVLDALGPVDPEATDGV